MFSTQRQIIHYFNIINLSSEHLCCCVCVIIHQNAKNWGLNLQVFSLNPSFVCLHLQHVKVLITIYISFFCLSPHLWWSHTRAFNRELSLFSDLRLVTKFLFFPCDTVGFWSGFFASHCYILFIYTFIPLVNVFFSFSFKPTLLHLLWKGNNKRCRTSRVRVCSPGWLNRYLSSQHLDRFGLGFLRALGRVRCSCVVWGDRRWMKALDGGKSPPISCCPVSRRALRPELSKVCQGMPVSKALMSSDFFMPLIFSLVSRDWHLSFLGPVCLHCTRGEPGAVQYFHVSRVKGDEHYTCTLIYACEAANSVKCDLSTALLHDSSARCSVTLSDINPQPGRGKLLQSINEVLGWERY